MSFIYVTDAETGTKIDINSEFIIAFREGDFSEKTPGTLIVLPNGIQYQVLESQKTVRKYVTQARVLAIKEADMNAAIEAAQK